MCVIEMQDFISRKYKNDTSNPFFKNSNFNLPKNFFTIMSCKIKI